LWIGRTGMVLLSIKLRLVNFCDHWGIDQTIQGGSSELGR
jgi:hypothetical protein